MDDRNFTENIALKRIKRSVSNILIIAIIISAGMGALFGYVASDFRSSFEKKGETEQSKDYSEAPNEKISLKEEESAVIDVVDSASSSVVSIIITKDVPKIDSFFSNPFGFDPFFDPFGSSSDQQGGATQKQEVGGGSGFIATADGIIVTNKHVISDQSAEYTVMTSDGKKFAAKVLAMDPTNDIAYLKIESGEKLKPLELGDSGNLKIGQTVIAIGNALGEFRNTVSKGIISGLKRSVTAGSGLGATEQLSQVIQTDAAINPGNSGGPLLDISGQVIGINVAMAQGAENIGFALPINAVKKGLKSVEEQGRIVQPYLGVRYVEINAQIKSENNLPYEYGVLILRGQRITDFAVVPGSPADKAGIVENDIILEINDQKIDSEHRLVDMLGQFSVGDTVSLKLWHKGEEKTIEVRLEERK